MPLKLSLKPGEKFVLNGAVVQNGDRRSALLLQNKASVLRDFVRGQTDKGSFKKAPSYDTDHELSLDDEASIYGYYGRDYAPAGENARRLAKR